MPDPASSAAYDQHPAAVKPAAQTATVGERRIADRSRATPVQVSVMDRPIDSCRTDEGSPREVCSVQNRIILG